MFQTEIIDFTNLIQMYLVKIKDVIQNWKESLNKKTHKLNVKSYYFETKNGS